jgi:hypothetical protein
VVNKLVYLVENLHKMNISYEYENFQSIERPDQVYDWASTIFYPRKENYKFKITQGYYFSKEDAREVMIIYMDKLCVEEPLTEDSIKVDFLTVEETLDKIKEN